MVASVGCVFGGGGDRGAGIPAGVVCRGRRKREGTTEEEREKERERAPAVASYTQNHPSCYGGPGMFSAVPAELLSAANTFSFLFFFFFFVTCCANFSSPSDFGVVSQPLSSFFGPARLGADASVGWPSDYDYTRRCWDSSSSTFDPDGARVCGIYRRMRRGRPRTAAAAVARHAICRYAAVMSERRRVHDGLRISKHYQGGS